MTGTAIANPVPKQIVADTTADVIPDSLPKPKKRQDHQYDDDYAYDVDNAVHEITFCLGLNDRDYPRNRFTSPFVTLPVPVHLLGTLAHIAATQCRTALNRTT